MRSSEVFSSKGYWLTRTVFQRGLALVYLIAFLAALNQFNPLLGDRGLLPVAAFVKEIPFHDAPSLFYLYPHDAAFTTAAWLGIVLSCLALTGIAERFGTWLSIAVWTMLWTLYLSFVNVGQIFYGFGWEDILLEAGFFAIFLGARGVEALVIPLWLLRWLEFRIMFGAGLIKLRGDPCWRDYTCLDYHYETQPMPNPLSWYLHWAPAWTHRFGVGFNHFSELVVPFAYFLPQPYCTVAGLITILFQLSIMASGNLSWLNFMTAVLAIPLVDDRFLALVVRARPPALRAPNLPYKAVLATLGLVVAYLSVNPIRNLISTGQIMNTSYNPLHLVGTYGAFGSVTKTRNEIVVEGSPDGTNWLAYEFKGKPGDPLRMPPQVAPYHLRLDWLMWFAAMSDYMDHPWFVHFLEKLLQGDQATLGLLKTNPFPGHPPHYIRADLYEYHFATPDERKSTGAWWKRRRTGAYFPPVSLDMPEFHQLLRQAGWL
jgi:hypothetical protein